MIVWLILVFAVSISAEPQDTAQYECGSHGRFEYCIDDIPGCVIGCHCHPGYYFDTDTKICEPNTKLLQNYRRQYLLEPTRAPLSQMDYPEIIEQATSIPTAGALDDHVDTIAKNTDELGDWLYNQFFKTIESQVINKTNENVISRRSGKGSEIKIVNNRRKNGKKKLKQKKQKKEDLRRKLLRITEDDSLFDSNTETDSSDSSSSKEQKDSNDKEHGHKKFVILNKKPKPPLPSFIFLPNIDTQFYPPVGLPPPILPMYPMVPVPPVVPAFPFPNVPPDCDQNQTVTATVDTTLYTTTSKITTASKQSVATESSTDPVTSTSTASPTTESKIKDVRKLRARYKQRKNLGGDGNETLRRLRQLVQNAALKKQRTKQSFPEEVTNRESIEIDESFQVEPISNEDNHQETKTKTSSIEDNKANFKYLSQLIHRIDLNDSKKSEAPRIKITSKSRRPFQTYQSKSVPTNLKVSAPSRRFNIQKYPQQLETPDSFYSKLGHQIATLIRDVDAKNDRQIDIEIEHMDQNTPNYPIFSDLSYAPHSYWERFARSPVNYHKRYQNTYNNIKKSNNKESLYDIESKVKIAISTMSPMTLQEIENFINKIKKSEDKFLDTDSRNYQFYNNTLNINLWPLDPLIDKDLDNPSKSYAKKLEENNYAFHTNSEAFRAVATRLTGEHSVDNNLRNTKQNKKLDNASKNGIRKVALTNTQIKSLNFVQNKVPNRVNTPFNLKPPPIRHANKLDFQSKPRSNFYNYNNKRINENYQYPFFNNLLQFKFPAVEKSVNVPSSRTESPSYFQHEIRHFDYID